MTDRIGILPDPSRYHERRAAPGRTAEGGCPHMTESKHFGRGSPRHAQSSFHRFDDLRIYFHPQVQPA